MSATTNINTTNHDDQIKEATRDFEAAKARQRGWALVIAAITIAAGWSILRTAVLMTTTNDAVYAAAVAASFGVGVALGHIIWKALFAFQAARR